MAKSNVKSGNYYKKKTKEYFTSLGYQCEYLEKYINKGRFFKKEDVFGSDGLAMNGTDIIFWNSKSSEDMKKRRGEMVRGATLEFERYVFPLICEQWIVLWSHGENVPEIVKL